MAQNIILTHQEIEHKIKRIAYQIYETFVDEEEIVIAGIASNGSVFAQKLALSLGSISTLKISLCEVKVDKQNPQLPIMVANGTAYNNGERFPFMPHIIRALKINSSLAPNKASLPLDGNEINNGYDFPLTYAITASSAFPGVLPKTKFGIKNQDKILCVIDGGASDNMGYETLIELLHNDAKVKDKNKKALFI